jgi:hypothetical protein
MRALSAAVPIAIAICAAAPAFADAQSNVQAAKKHEKRGEWKKALESWKAAYNADINAEYLIGIGDCYAHLGNNEEAKKNYNAYLADPLALPTNVEKVKTKIAALESTAGGLALPGAGLALPGADAQLPLPGLDLPGTSPAVAEKKGKPKPPAQVAKSDPGLSLPGLELPGTPAPSKKETVASTSPSLELPGLPMPPPPPASKPEKKDQPAVANNKPLPSSISGTKDPTGGKQMAIVTKPEPRRVPDAAIAEPPAPRPQPEPSGTGKVVAYVAAGVAVVALGGGAFAYTRANSNHSDLTGKVHDGATAQSLLESESKNKTLSFVGLAGGLVAAGIATALFAF